MASDRALLRDLLLLTKDGEWGSGEPGAGLEPMRVIRGTDFASVRFGDLGRVPLRYIPRQIAERKRLQPRDILIETAGGTKDQPTGRTTILKAALFDRSPYSLTCASFSRFLRVDPALADAEYVFWYLQHMYCCGQMDEHQVQHTGVARFQYTSFASATEIPLPSSDQQRAIAAILGALDDKIELNRRTNSTLESMARALFKSWFVDFNPVRAKAEGRQPAGIDAETAALFPAAWAFSDEGPIPKGWRTCTVADVAEFNSRTLSANDDLSELEYIEISGVAKGDILNTSWYSRAEAPSRARRQLRHGDTVLSTVRPDRGAYFLALNPHSRLIASTGFAVVSPRSIPWSFLHCALTQPAAFDYLGLHADGGAYPAVSPETVGAWHVTVPCPSSLLERFQFMCSPFFERAHNGRAESRTLAALRDTLLPKLISGELRIRDAESLVEAHV